AHRPGASRCAPPRRAASAGRRRVASIRQGAPADGGESLALRHLQYGCGAAQRAEGAERRSAATMNVLVYLVPLALALGALGLAAFLWALKHGQFEDL